MKSHTLTAHAAAHVRSHDRMAYLIRQADSLPCLAFVILASVIPPIGLVLLATWASGNAIALPVTQAATGVGGFVFLALAMDADRRVASLLAATALALFALSWASVAVASEWVIVASMAVAAWAGAGSFSLVRRHCL